MKEKKEEIEEENKVIELRVIRSKIKGKQGVVRINERHLGEVDFEEGDSAELMKKGADSGIIVKVFADHFMKPGIISVREEDMKKMKVEEGEELILRSYETYREKIRDGYEHVKEKLKRKKDEDEEEEKGEKKKSGGKEKKRSA